MRGLPSAVSIFSLEGSIAVTIAPSLLRDSASSPPPQPISITRSFSICLGPINFSFFSIFALSLSGCHIMLR